MRTALPVRPRLHRILLPVAFVAAAAAILPAGLVLLAAYRQAASSATPSAVGAGGGGAPVQRTCADLPSENARSEGLAEPLARRRGEKLGEGRCGVITGVPASSGNRFDGDGVSPAPRRGGA